jgi:predicted flavoprotein YhiN
MTRSVRRRTTIAGIGVAGAGAVLALVLAGPNIAQADPSASPSASASAAPGAGADKAGREAKRAQAQADLAAKLAKELGVDQAKVQAALEKIQSEQQAQAKADRLAALKQRLDQAVTDGKLTRAEADAIYKAAENGVIPGGAGRGEHGHRGPGS